jgi:hypothetical protein
MQVANGLAISGEGEKDASVERWDKIKRRAYSHTIKQRGDTKHDRTAGPGTGWTRKNPNDVR